MCIICYVRKAANVYIYIIPYIKVRYWGAVFYCRKQWHKMRKKCMRVLSSYVMFKDKLYSDMFVKEIKFSKQHD